MQFNLPPELSCFIFAGFWFLMGFNAGISVTILADKESKKSKEIE